MAKTRCEIFFDFQVSTIDSSDNDFEDELRSFYHFRETFDLILFYAIVPKLSKCLKFEAVRGVKLIK